MTKRVGGFIGQDGINAPDPATGVSASGGDAEATVSFTAPSDVGGAAITGYSVVADDGSNASPYFSGTTYSNKSLDVSAQVSGARDVAFNGDGSKAYVTATNNSSVYQYSLSVPFDVSTGSYDSVSFNFASQDTSPQGVAFNSDGTKMYMAGNQVDNVFQYSLSTAYNVGTASYDSVSFSISSQDSFAYGVNFNTNGTKMYVLGGGTDSVYQYSLSTAFNLGTASYDSVSFSFSSEASLGNGMAFSSTGSSVFIIGTTNTVYQYSLSTAFNLSTASYAGISFSVGSQDGGATGVTFNNSGTNMYVMGSNNNAVYQYSVPDYPTASPVTVTGLTNGTSYTFNVWAINPFGWSSPSDASGSVSPVAPTALFGGGNGSKTIHKIIIPSLGNATDFGDLTAIGANNYWGAAAIGNEARAIWAGGLSINTIQFVTFSSGGDASDFGDIAANNYFTTGTGNTTRGLVIGGVPDNINGTRIQYITIASAGNSTDFGDLSARAGYLGSASSSTRSVKFGGDGDGISEIEYVTIASTGDATDFGDPTGNRYACSSCSSATRAVTGGGQGGANIMDYVTIASTGNATDFGDMVVNRSQVYGAASSSTRGIFGGGGSPALAAIDYFEIATTGNASDFGDLVAATTYISATSNAHGGI